MDSHPKKQKEKPVQSKSEINPRSRRWQRKPNTVHTKQKQTKSHYPILQYKFVYQQKKKPNIEKTKPQTQSKLNPRWDADGHVARRRSLLCRSSSLSTRRRLIARASSQIIVDCKSVLGCSGARRSASRYFSLTLSLSLFLTQMKNMNVRILSDVSLSLSLYSSISNLVILSLSFEIWIVRLWLVIGCWIFTLFFFFVENQSLLLTLLCFLPVFWLYLGFILFVADLLLVSDSVCLWDIDYF